MEIPHRPLEQNNNTGNPYYVPLPAAEQQTQQSEITSPASAPAPEVAPSPESTQVQAPSEHRPVAYTVDRPQEPQAPVSDVPSTSNGSKHEWRKLDVHKLKWPMVNPFVIVDGITLMRDFDAVEGAAVAKVSPLTAREGVDAATAREFTLVSDRISNHLRPPKSNGSVRQGQALIVPFDTERALAHSGKRWARSIPTDETILNRAIGVLYTGILRSPKGETDQILCEATYFQRRPELQKSHEGYVLRSHGPSQVVEGLADALDLKTADPQAVSRALAARAIRHAYPDGIEQDSRRQ
jgi:hypothetical protein